MSGQDSGFRIRESGFRVIDNGILIDIAAVRFLQYPVDHGLDGFRLLAKVSVRAESLASVRACRFTAVDGDQWILSCCSKLFGFPVWRFPAAVTDVMYEQKRRAYFCVVESAEPRSVASISVKEC